MNDDLGLFADDAGDNRRKNRREKREHFRRRKRNRTVTVVAGLFVLFLVGGGTLFGASQILEITRVKDFEGGGTGQVVIEVESGDTVSAIAETMESKGVVASSKAFVAAAEGNASINSVQPGFYLMKSRMSGASAVRHMLSPEATVGRVEIRAGTRLEDQVAPNGGTTPGILTKLAQASCAGSKQDCVSSEELHKVAATADLGKLGVPKWAIGPASQAEPKRRLEGLIMPDLYDVKPGSSAEDLLRDVLSESAAQLEQAGLPDIAQQVNYSPYEVLTIASLAQSEGIEKDFGKVSRVIHNRMRPQQTMPLQMDSTINYPLDKPSLLTKAADRDRPGPYNTYDNPGLPPTPISSASEEAITAAAKPAQGDWKYFVKCYPDGTSCFAANEAQHEQYKKEAQERGAY